MNLQQSQPSMYLEKGLIRDKININEDVGISRMLLDFFEYPLAND